MKKIVPLFLAFFFLTACAPRESAAEFSAMDTVMRVTAYGAGAGEALVEVQREIFRLDALLSRARPESDVSRLNEAAGSGRAVPLSPETVALLQKARDYAPDFDVTVAPVLDAWGFGASPGGEAGALHRVPTAAELSELLPLVDASLLELDAAASTAYLPRAGMGVDLGGVGKGHAGDRAAAVLREHGVASALLYLGGNVTVVGNRPDGAPWRVGVADPREPGDYFCVLSLADQTAATSGGYQRFFEVDGAAYHHIIDPATGRPADSGLLSATAVTGSGADADLLSTYCFILGPDRALAAWRNQDREAADRYELVLVRTDGTVLITEGLEAGLTFQGEERGYAYEIVRR